MWLCVAAGRGITRLRSLRLEQRLQENSQAQLIPMNRVQYDYPTTQVHPYHVLEGPPTVDPDNTLGNYTTMQPAGSVREGAITPMGNGAHTIHSIYDDDVTSGEHGDLAPDLVGPPSAVIKHVISCLSLQPPRPVQDTPFYHILEVPGQMHGHAVSLCTFH